MDIHVTMCEDVGVAGINQEEGSALEVWEYGFGAHKCWASCPEIGEPKL